MEAAGTIKSQSDRRITLKEFSEGYLPEDVRESFLEIIIQIWDPKNGLIVWEGMGSATLASEALRAKNIAFKDITMLLTRKILEKLPA